MKCIRRCSMKMRLYIHILFRSLLKTFVTLLLLTVTAFLFLYNLAEYSVSARQYREARDRYEGVLTAEVSAVEKASTMPDFFLMTDPTNPGRTFDRVQYEEYHHESISQELADALSTLPYISRVEQRCMTAGVSPDYFRMDTDIHLFPYASRAVLVATIGEKTIDPDESGLIAKGYPTIAKDGFQYITLENIEMLAGDPEWLKGDWSQKIELHIPREDMRDQYIRLFWTDYVTVRDCMFSIDPRLYMEDVDALKVGRRYVFVLRNNSNILSTTHFFNVGDDSLADWWPYFTDVTDLPDGWLETDEFAALRELIQVTNDDVHTFDVVYGDDMKAIRRVAQGRIICDEGRLIDPADVGQPVCVVSTDFLKTNGLQVGDAITLNLGNYLCEQYAPLGAVASTRGRHSTAFKMQEFTIIGAWRDLNEGNHVPRDLYWCWSNNAVFVPSAYLPVCVNAETYTPKPAELSFVVGNAENIVPFTEKGLPQVEAMGLAYTFDDWGWTRVAMDLLQARNLARIKLLIFSGAAVLAILLTVWLFIGRKKREFGVLRALGMPRKEASAWLFCPFLYLGAVSTLLGALIAWRMNIRQLQRAAEGTEMAVPAGAGIYLLGALGFLAALALLAWADIALIRKKSILELIRADDGAPERRTQEAEMPSAAALDSSAVQWTTRDLGGSKSKHWRGRYLRRLMGRNPVRSSLSLILSALLILAFGLLTVLRSIYRELYQNVEVKPVISGGITYERAKTLAESGYVRDPYYEYVFHEGMVEMREGDSCPIIMTNHLDRLVTEPVEWLEGWDEETAMNTDDKICVLHAPYAVVLGKSLGDTIRLNEQDWWPHLSGMGLNPLRNGETPLDRRDAHRPFVKIVGLIQGTAENNTVYLPVAAWNRFAFLVPEGCLDLAQYTLLDYHQAAEFEAYAADMLSRSKKPIQITVDTSYADRLYQIHRLIETLYPLAVAAALLLGGVLPGLAVLHASKEISILRALGVPAKDCVLLYTLSQVLCALAGLVLGIALVLVIQHPEWSIVIVPFALYVSAHMAACALGSGVFAWMCARKHVLAQLQVKE